jgi:hypothetical protein
MLQLFRIKPNPRGKDHPKSGPLDPAQLAGEWIDIRNADASAVNLDGLELRHAAYGRGCSSPTWQRVMSFRGSLEPGKTLRVHAGQVRSISLLHPEDVAGAVHHLFTGDDRYVWNNMCGDTAGLVRGGTMVDQASYAPNPPEGQVLYRTGDRFIATSAASSLGLR